MLAHRESNTASAVVGTGAVVADSAAKLGEHQQDYVVTGVVVPQVGDKGLHVVRHITPQAGVEHRLVGVGVKAVVRRRGVENPAAELGQVGLGNVLHILADRGGGVLHVGGVLVRGGSQDVGALEGVGAGAVDVVQDGAAANGRRIHPPENVQSLVPLAFAFDAGQQAVGLQVAHGSNGHTIHSQGAGQAAAKVHTGQHVLRSGVNLLEHAAQPALGANLVRLAGVPDVHGAEMGVAGVVVTHAQEDGELALVPELLQRPHRRVKAQLVVKLENLTLGDTQVGPVVPIQRVGIGYHGVQAVIAARKGKNGQYRVFLRRNHSLFSYN